MAAVVPDGGDAFFHALKGVLADARVVPEHDWPPSAALRPAAVLVPLVERPEGTTVLLTRRTEHLQHHPGQISFPGGRIEHDDADATDAALRETAEETGLVVPRSDVLGALPDYPTSTGFLMTPCVARLRPPLALRPDPGEVAEVFEVPLRFICEARHHQRHAVHWGGRLRHFWAMPWGDYYIWGATAGILVTLHRAVAALRDES